MGIRWGQRSPREVTAREQVATGTITGPEVKINARRPDQGLFSNLPTSPRTLLSAKSSLVQFVHLRKL